RDARAAPDVVVVEKDREQPYVVARRLRLFVVIASNGPRRVLAGLEDAAVELDQLEGVDLLRLVVFADVEVGFLKVVDRVALLVGDDDVDADVVDAGLENRRRLLARRRLRRRRRLLLLLLLLSLLSIAPEGEDG